MNKSAIAASLAALFFAVACDTESKKKSEVPPTTTQPNDEEQKTETETETETDDTKATGTEGDDSKVTSHKDQPSASKMEEEEAQKAHDRQLEEIIHQPKELETSTLENAQVILEEVEKATEEVAASQGANDAEETKRAANALENAVNKAKYFLQNLFGN